jgi:hypothetical protein
MPLKEPIRELSKTLLEVRKGCRNRLGEYALFWRKKNKAVIT